MVAGAAHHFHAPPLPPDALEARRWTETRRRRRMLEGTWREDLEHRALEHFGGVRLGVMGPLSLAKCPAKRVCEELASLYYDTPRVRHGADNDAAQGLIGSDGLLDRAGLWPSMRRFQVATLALRERLLRIEWENDGLCYRAVSPETVVAVATDAAPETPIEIWELRWRDIRGVGGRWCWDILSIADPENPTYRVVEYRSNWNDPEIDHTAKVLGGDWSGANYPYRWTQGVRAGKPFLPYVLYHAEKSACLFDAWNWQELFEASLDLAVLWSFWQHGVFRASWPQRWAMNAFVAGTVPEDSKAGPRSQVPTDPTTLVHLIPGQQGIQPQVGQWTAAFSPKDIGESIGDFEATVIAITGVDAAHIVREGSSPQSGAALSINRDGKRESQRVFAPQFRPRDLETIEKSAAIANWATGSTYPEEGYRIDYATIPLSPTELEGRRRHHSELIDAGRLSLTEAYREEHPGATEDEALEALVDMRVQKLRIDDLAKKRAQEEGLLAIESETDFAGTVIEKGFDAMAKVRSGEFSVAQGRAALVIFCGITPEAAASLIPDDIEVVRPTDPTHPAPGQPPTPQLAA
jgi:hypothetical protein